MLKHQSKLTVISEDGRNGTRSPGGEERDRWERGRRSAGLPTRRAGASWWPGRWRREREGDERESKENKCEATGESREITGDEVSKGESV